LFYFYRDFICKYIYVYNNVLKDMKDNYAHFLFYLYIYISNYWQKQKQLYGLVYSFVVSRNKEARCSDEGCTQNAVWDVWEQVK
jgi:hypothetical protein